MTQNWIDAHVHLSHFKDKAALDKILTESRKLGAVYFFQAGVDPTDWLKQKEIHDQNPDDVGVSFGLHPWWIASHSDQECSDSLEILKKEIGTAQALGELGLDHGVKMNAESFPRQLRFFREQLTIAKNHQKPLILHVVKAHDEALAELRLTPPVQGGLVHSFSGNLQIANQYIELGLLISVGPGLLKQGFESLKKMIRKVELTNLVLETDCPDQLPEPKSILEVAKAVSDLRGDVGADDVLKITTENFRRQFKIKYGITNRANA